MIDGQYAQQTQVTAAEVHPDNEAALRTLFGGVTFPFSDEGIDQRMIVQRMPPETDQPLTGVIIPSILADGSFYREADGRVREYGRDFYVGAVLVRHENGALDAYASVAEFLAAYPVKV